MEEIFNNLDNQSLDDNTLINLKFKFSMSERFIHAKNEENKYFQFQTPFLKVLKPIYLTYNKKKSISKKYLILETTHEIDFNNEIDDFIYTINKIHEVSQENIKEKSLTWFKTEFDDIGLDMKVKRPIDQQKNSEFIKICLPNNNSELEEKVSKLNKGDYILCNLQFKGLKVSSESIVEEIELINFVTQNDFDDYQKEEYIDNLLTEDVADVVDLNIENLIEEIVVEKPSVSNDFKKLTEEIPDGYEKLVLNNNTTDVIVYEEKKEVEENIEENIETNNGENIKHIEIKKVISNKNKDPKKINKKLNYVRKISKKIIFT